MFNGAEHQKPKIRVIWDLDNSFKYGPPSGGTTFALLIRKYQIYPVDGLVLPESPHYRQGFRGILDKYVEPIMHRWRKPKKSAIEFTRGMRDEAEKNGREIEIEFGSGRRPDLHKMTYHQLRGLYPPGGTPRTNELIDRVHLNPGVKSPRFKALLGKNSSEEGNKTIYIEDDIQAAEGEAEYCDLVYLLTHWYNFPSWKLLMWWGRRGRDPLPGNIVRVRNFDQAFDDFKTRLADGRL